MTTDHLKNCLFCFITGCGKAADDRRPLRRPALRRAGLVAGGGRRRAPPRRDRGGQALGHQAPLLRRPRGTLQYTSHSTELLPTYVCTESISSVEITLHAPAHVLHCRDPLT